VVLRVISESGAASIHIVRPDGAGLLLPSFLRPLFADPDATSRDRRHLLDELRQVAPKSAAAIDQSGWLNESVVFREVLRTPRLKRLQIEVLLTCNLRCSYCYSTSGPGRRERLTSAEVIDAISQGDRLGIHQLDLTGGELLLDRQWPDYVRHARDLGISVTLHTNGTLIGHDAAQRMRDLSVSHCQVSLDSHNPELHNLSRGHKTALQRTLRGLDILTEHHVPVRIALMAHKANSASFPETIEFFSERYPTAKLVIDRVVATNAAAEEAGLSSEEFWRIVAPYVGTVADVTKVCESGLEMTDYEPECGVAYSYIYLTGEGEIAACPTMTSRESDEFAGPNFRTTAIGDAWYDSAFFQSFRFTNCENVTSCPAGSSCGGGCRSNAYSESGYVEAPDLVACNTNKNPDRSVFIDFSSLYDRIRR
jgi:radical SAM protein with 4Fe4S-binding SPASM domain